MSELTHSCMRSLVAALCLLLLPQVSLAQINCNQFWSGRTPLRGYPDGPIMCEEYTPGDDTDSVLGGYEYRIFLEAGIDPDDLQPQLSWMAEAIDETVGEYRWITSAGLGDVLFFIFVTSSPSATAEGETNYVMAAASRNYESSPREPCPITFYPYGMTAGYEDFKQALAHEAFHCIQSTHFWDQMDIGSRDNRWWIEGTAMYFSNVVYPDFNKEWPFSQSYDPGDGSVGAMTLFDHVYGSNFFFQDLSNHIGKEDTVVLIQLF